MEEILIKYRSNDIPKLENIGGSNKSAMIDLYTEEDYYVKPGNYYLLSLGVSMSLPNGYHGIVIPRSSTFKKYGILQANSVGCIDNSYNGNNDIWKFPIFVPITTDNIIDMFINVFEHMIEENMDDFKNKDAYLLPKLNLSEYIKNCITPDEIYIEKGTRICQFKIEKTIDVNFIETDNLSTTDRGGFGSTGK